MKIIKLLLLYVILINTVILSCKKGEDDPFLSFRSRKARLTGEWKLDYGKEETTYNDTLQTVTLNGVTAGVVTTTTNGTLINNFSDNYNELWIINKDYSFEIIKNYSWVKITLKGVWGFNYKNKDMKLKNKESFTFKITSESYDFTSSVNNFTNTYSGFDCPTLTYQITELKNNEIIVSYTGESIYDSSINKTNSTYTFKQEKQQ